MALLAGVIGLEMLAGLITNFFVLVLTLCHFKTWKKLSIIFLTNMLFNNLMVILSVMPFSIITCAKGEWIFGNTRSQKIAICQFTAYIISFNLNMATDSLALVSFDRFFFIVKALQYEKYMTVNKAVIIVAASWIMAAILSSPPLFGFGGYEFSPYFGFCVPSFSHNAALAAYCFIIFSVLIAVIVITSIWTFFIPKIISKKEIPGCLPVMYMCLRKEDYWIVWYAHYCALALLCTNLCTCWH